MSTNPQPNPHAYRISITNDTNNIILKHTSPTYEGAKHYALTHTSIKKLGIVRVVEDKPFLYMLTTYKKNNRYTIIVYKG